MSRLEADVWRYIGDSRAVNRVKKYYLNGKFTGRRFERLGGGGDAAEVANRFTGDDLVAVTLLSVDILGEAAITILEDTSIGAGLNEIPCGVDLWDAPRSVVEPSSAAEQVWRRLKGIGGVGWVTADKLLARKRPRLLPVYDRISCNNLGRGGGT